MALQTKEYRTIGGDRAIVVSICPGKQMLDEDHAIGWVYDRLENAWRSVNWDEYGRASFDGSADMDDLDLPRRLGASVDAAIETAHRTEAEDQ